MLRTSYDIGEDAAGGSNRNENGNREYGGEKGARDIEKKWSHVALIGMSVLFITRIPKNKSRIPSHRKYWVIHLKIDANVSLNFCGERRKIAEMIVWWNEIDADVFIASQFMLRWKYECGNKQGNVLSAPKS